jgi:hypothetical protein
MSTYTSEPGTRLAGRYRLVDQVSAGAGWTYWKATDETLARSVTVLTFSAGFPRVSEAVTAARTASRLGDPRFSQVFDVEDTDDGAYAVLEWVAGESLLDMLSEGPLDPPVAAALIAEAARALAVAHNTGLAHLRLDPACLHWTSRGGVKITGLAIAAALTGPDLASGTGEDSPGDPDVVDTQGLARLLYAALTGYWPGDEGADASAPGLLPPAPEDDGIPCAPRQVSAGVPAGIDDVTCRALFQQESRHGSALSSPEAFADALTSVAPPVPFPVSPATPEESTAAHYNGGTNPYLEADQDPRTWAGGSGRKPAGERSTMVRAVVSVAIVVVLAAVGVIAWSISHSMHHTASPAPSHSQSSSPTAASSAVLLTPVSDNSFDALGTDGGNENADDARYAIDGSTSTAWHTDYYYGESTLGNLKKGTGLILDLGKQVQLSQVTVQFGTVCCTHVQIEIGNTDTPTAAGLSSFTTVQTSTTAQGVTNFNVAKKATGRYVLIWITDLPARAGSSGSYEAFIYNVILHGSAVRQSG